MDGLDVNRGAIPDITQMNPHATSPTNSQKAVGSDKAHAQVITPETNSQLRESSSRINTCQSPIVQKNAVVDNWCKLQQNVPPSQMQGGNTPSASLRVMTSPMAASMDQLNQVLSTWSKALSKLPDTPILTDLKSVFNELHEEIFFGVFDVTPDHFIVFVKDEDEVTQGFAIAHQIKDTPAHSIKIDYLMAAPWNISEEGARVYAKENNLSPVRGAGTSCLLGCIKYSSDTFGIQYPGMKLDATKTGVDFYEKRNFTRIGEGNELTQMHLTSDNAQALFTKFQKTIT